MYTGIPLTLGTFTPGPIHCSNFHIDFPLHYMSIRPPDLRACERVIQLLPDHHDRYRRDIAGSTEYVQTSTNSTCEIIIENMILQGLPRSGEEVHWPGIRSIAEKILDECFSQPGHQHVMGMAAVWPRQWTRSPQQWTRSPRFGFMEDRVYMWMYLYRNPLAV
jgi:hypothetical protein